MTGSENRWTRGRGLPADTGLALLLAALAGLVGAAAYTHSAGFFVTFMTGNTERAILGWFTGNASLAIGATTLLCAFLAGVVLTSALRRRWQSGHPVSATVLATIALFLGLLADLPLSGADLDFLPIAFVAAAMGALNTSFTSAGEVAVPLSYVTGTWVKLGQGLERHLAGGSITEWSGYALMLGAFAAGALAGGALSLLVGGSTMLAVAATAAACTSILAHRHQRASSVPPETPAEA